MKKLSTLLAVLLCCLLLGCQQEQTPYVPTGDGLYWDDGTPVNTTVAEEEPEQELVLVYYPEKTLNPYKSTDFTNRTLFSLLYQSLFVVDSDYQVSPMLCSRYTMSEDMRTYTFYINEATFSDGSILTIEDVYASIQAARDSAVYKGRFIHVTDIKLGETGGIIFKLKTAHENFPILLDIPILKSTEVAEDAPLGTGPYLLEQTNAGNRLRRRTDWWCDYEMIITASSIPLRVAESVTQIRDTFEFEDVGLVCADPGSDTYADYRCDYELWDCENGGFVYIGCNIDSNVFSKPAVRAALTHAIDRDALVRDFYRNFAHSATLPASPLSPYYSNQLAAKYTYDPERFMQALSDNYLSGSTITILVNKRDTLRLRMARAIGQMLEDCGLVVEMLETTGNDYYYYLNIREYDLYLGQTRLSANMDLSAFFKEGGAMRYGGMTDAATYALCLEALANQGNYYDLHETIMKDGRLCPVLFQTYSIHATRGLLTGLTPSRDNVFYYTSGKTMEEILE